MLCTAALAPSLRPLHGACQRCFRRHVILAIHLLVLGALVLDSAGEPFLRRLATVEDDLVGGVSHSFRYHGAFLGESAEDDRVAGAGEHGERPAREDGLCTRGRAEIHNAVSKIRW